MRTALALSFLLIAGVAQAEPLDLKPQSQSPAPKLNLSRAALSQADSRLLELRAMGATETAVARAVGGGSAAFGFLCGLNPGQNLGGVHAARGYDPQGKFMGAKLSLPF